jgi:hypothetical protein
LYISKYHLYNVLGGFLSQQQKGPEIDFWVLGPGIPKDPQDLAKIQLCVLNLIEQRRDIGIVAVVVGGAQEIKLVATRSECAATRRADRQAHQVVAIALFDLKLLPSEEFFGDGNPGERAPADIADPRLDN